MPSTYTTNDGLELQATGENENTWGDRLNTLFESLDAQHGNTSISADTGTVTLSIPDGSITGDDGRAFYINVTNGPQSGNLTIVLPAGRSRTYVVETSYSSNNGNTLTIETDGGSGVSMEADAVYMVFNNGNNTFQIMAIPRSVIFDTVTSDKLSSINESSPSTDLVSETGIVDYGQKYGLGGQAIPVNSAPNNDANDIDTNRIDVLSDNTTANLPGSGSFLVITRERAGGARRLQWAQELVSTQNEPLWTRNYDGTSWGSWAQFAMIGVAQEGVTLSYPSSGTFQVGGDFSVTGSSTFSGTATFSGAIDATSSANADFDHINLANHEIGDHTTAGDLFFDGSHGLYLYGGGSARLNWSSQNFTDGDGIDVSYDAQDSPTLSVASDVLRDSNLDANGGSIPEVDRSNAWSTSQTNTGQWLSKSSDDSSIRTFGAQDSSNNTVWYLRAAALDGTGAGRLDFVDADEYRFDADILMNGSTVLTEATSPDQAYELLGSGGLSGGSTVLATGIGSQYQSVEICLDRVDVNANAQIRLQLTTDNGSTWDNISTISINTAGTDTQQNNNAIGYYFVRTLGRMGVNHADTGLGFTVVVDSLFNEAGGADRTGVSARQVNMGTVNSPNGFRLVAGGTSFTGGTFAIYGKNR